MDKAQEVPIPVIESLGFGGDNQETLQLAPGELDDLAKDFQNFQLDGEKMDDISPAPAPPAFWLFLSLRTCLQ